MEIYGGDLSERLDRFKGRPFEVKRARRKWVVLSGSFLVGLFLADLLFDYPSRVFTASRRPSCLRDAHLPGAPASYRRRGGQRTKHSFPILIGEEHSSSMDRSDHFQIEALCKF